MPINDKLKTQLAAMPMDEAYRAKLLETLEDAPPDIQNLWMAREDYTRQVNAFRAEQADWKAKADKFYDDSNTAIDGWKAEVKKFQDVATAAQTRITELEGVTAATPATAQPDPAVLKEITGLKTMMTALEAKLAEAGKDVVRTNDLEKAYANAVGFIGENVTYLREIERKHQDTFGQYFDREKVEDLFKFANDLSQKEGRRVSLDKAYDTKYGTELQKKHDEAVAAKAIEDYRSRQEIPTGQVAGGAGIPDKGPLQIRLDQERQAQSGKKEGFYGDWREAAAAAADELVKEGKF